MTTEPNPSELEVLKALWSHDRLSAREVHDKIGEAQGWSYSTTRTVIQRMVDKGLVNKDSVHGLAVFAAADRKVDLISRLVRSFTKRVLEVDGALPVSAFTGSALLNAQELEELEQILEAPATPTSEKRSDP
ncbi:BlaI/MecI/CopY family transcriptional regulator [Oceanicaulis alexandrii]|uniref:BlaI/MecI/CopY family transcriptional regulator n=1 Tax=Oceanicaulis alexandrii TaxID=153233 RepID=UPI0035D0A9B7